MTNGDKIRAMSDWGLAEYLAFMIDCPTCPVIDDCHGDNCSDILLDWLKQEAKDE